MKTIEVATCCVFLGMLIVTSCSTAPPLTPTLACAYTPFETTASTVAGQEDNPWVKAVPHSAQIIAHVYPLPNFPNDIEQPLRVGKRKVLWQIENPKRADTLEIVGTNLNTGDNFRFTSYQSLSPEWAYPSEIDPLTPGCWRIALKSGEIEASITLEFTTN